ncbi:MAG TPA: acyl-CoA thioesterase [Cellulomonas sp.]
MARLRVPVQLRWSDMDAYAHVNNVEMLRLLEEARIEAFWAHPSPTGPAGAPTDDGTPEAAPAPAPASAAEDGTADGTVSARPASASVTRPPWPTAVLDAGPGAQTSTLVARQEIEYLRPLGYRRTPVIVDMWIGGLGGASLEVCYEVQDSDAAPGGTPFARASTTLVLVDATTGAPRRIAAAERTAWLPYVEEPVRFRRRGR